jgi:DNA-binding NtrC family response regulator
MELKRILVVERDIVVRHLLAQFLRDRGFRVAEAVSVEEAREALSHRRVSFDVALINLPSRTQGAFELASWMRKNFPDTEVLLAGTVAKVLQHADELCDGPDVPRPDHKAVLAQIRQALAARKRTGS